MSVAEGKTPQTIDCDGQPVRVLQESECGSGCRIERIDPSVAEVADQQRIAEGPKVRRSQRNSPRGIQRTLRHQPLYEPTVRPEHIHVAVAIARNVVVPR